ncbi:MAG: YkgJ family cysteine cluster protein [Cellvibrionaceae bacterium]
MICRPHCGACCIAPSINTPLPNMPNGKKAGEWCANLNNETLQCEIWGQENYPELCKSFKPCEDVCGKSREEAMKLIEVMEVSTR